MGSAASNLSVYEINEKIKTAIVSFPGHNFIQEQDVDKKFFLICQIMAKKGYRPITAQEYLSTLSCSKQEASRVLTFWKPLSKSSDESSYSVEAKSSTPLPTTDGDSTMELPSSQNEPQLAEEKCSVSEGRVERDRQEDKERERVRVMRESSHILKPQQLFPLFPSGLGPSSPPINLNSPQHHSHPSSASSSSSSFLSSQQHLRQELGISSHLQTDPSHPTPSSSSSSSSTFLSSQQLLRQELGISFHLSSYPSPHSPPPISRQQPNPQSFASSLPSQSSSRSVILPSPQTIFPSHETLPSHDSIFSTSENNTLGDRKINDWSYVERLRKMENKRQEQLLQLRSHRPQHLLNAASTSCFPSFALDTRDYFEGNRDQKSREEKEGDKGEGDKGEGDKGDSLRVFMDEESVHERVERGRGREAENKDQAHTWGRLAPRNVLVDTVTSPSSPGPLSDPCSLPIPYPHPYPHPYPYPSRCYDTPSPSNLLPLVPSSHPSQIQAQAQGVSSLSSLSPSTLWRTDFEADYLHYYPLLPPESNNNNPFPSSSSLLVPSSSSYVTLPSGSQLSVEDNPSFSCPPSSSSSGRPSAHPKKQIRVLHGEGGDEGRGISMASTALGTAYSPSPPQSPFSHISSASPTNGLGGTKKKLHHGLRESTGPKVTRPSTQRDVEGSETDQFVSII